MIILPFYKIVYPYSTVQKNKENIEIRKRPKNEVVIAVEAIVSSLIGLNPRGGIVGKNTLPRTPQCSEDFLILDFIWRSSRAANIMLSFLY